MKYSSGPKVPTMPKDGPDSVEVRSRVGDGRQFSPSAACNSRLLGFCQRKASNRRGRHDSAPELQRQSNH
jgi:hypothetical protein